MNDQLIVQLPITGMWGAPGDLELRHELEQELEVELEGIAQVDGGDIGSGNMNIFILEVENAAAAIDRIKHVLTRHSVLDRAIIEHTTFEDDDEDGTSVVVWPPNFKGTFSVL